MVAVPSNISIGSLLCWFVGLNIGVVYIVDQASKKQYFS